MKTRMGDRNEGGSRRKSGREKRGGKSRAVKLERRAERVEKADGGSGIGSGLTAPVMVD